MKPSSYHESIVDVMEELVRFAILTRPHAARLVDRKAAALKSDPSTDRSAITMPEQRRTALTTSLS